MDRRPTRPIARSCRCIAFIYNIQLFTHITMATAMKARILARLRQGPPGVSGGRPGFASRGGRFGRLLGA